MAEAAKGIADYMGENILYINVMNNLSVDCDCNGRPAAPKMTDIGILASLDPVALDQACVDLVYAASDGEAVIQRIESCNGIHTLEHAAAIGFGLGTGADAEGWVDLAIQFWQRHINSGVTRFTIF